MTVMTAQRRAQLISKHQHAIDVLIEKCPHDDLVTRCEAVECVGCGQMLGWTCSKSPVGYCEYRGESEYCRWCGEPEERK